MQIDFGNTRNKVIILTLILLLGFVLRVVFFTGYNSGDDRAYIAKAFEYASGKYEKPDNHWAVRNGIVFPTTMMIKAFGVNTISVVLIPFILSMLSMIIAYKFAFFLSDEKAALLTAMMVAIFPMEVLFASQLFPYTFLSFFSLVSLYCFVVGMTRENYSLFFLSGLSLGVAYLCRITALYSLLFFVLYFIFFNRRVDAILIFGAGLISIFCVEALLSYFFWNDAVTRYNILFARAGNPPDLLEKVTNLKWIAEPWVRPFFEQEFGFFFPVVCFAAVYQLVTRQNTKALILLLWIVPLFLYISYGTTSPTSYQTLRRLPRYYSIIIIPGLILMSMMLMQLNKKKLRWLIICVLSATSLMFLVIDNSKYQKQPFIAMTEMIKDYPSKNIVIDRSLIFDYLFFTRFKKSEKLSMLVNENDRSDTLKRIKTVYPSVHTINDLKDIDNNTLVVLSPGYYRLTEIEKQHLKSVQKIYRKGRSYYKLLALKSVRFLLKYVRDDKRLNMLLNHEKLVASIYVNEIDP